MSSDGVRSPLGAARVQALVRRVLDAEKCRAAIIGVTFVSARAIARLHEAHVGHAGVTDIVTLEHARAAKGAPVVGDIYIAPEVARANARSAGVGVREELARLTIHGVLHALGWEHPEGEGRTSSAMWRRQERLLAAVARDASA